MQVSETSVEGLKRELKVVIDAAELNGRLATELDDLKDKAQIKGFRKGKVPLSHLKKLYGKSIMAEVVQKLVNESSSKTLEDRNEKPAFQPKINLSENEQEIEKILQGELELAYTMEFEVLPEFALADMSGVEIEKPIVEPEEGDIEKQLKGIAENSQSFDVKEGAAEDGDRVKIDFKGSIDGAPFDGGSAEDADVVIGKKQFIPGFEEQLVGVKAGDEKDINVKFPDDYGAENLKGKDAVFAIKVKGVETPVEQEINDEFAKKIGFEDLEKLREMIKGNFSRELDGIVRQYMKRSILDVLNEKHDFELPPSLVESEMESIKQQLKQKMLEEQGEDLKAPAEGEEEADIKLDKSDDEILDIAKRRVKLGLVISEFGNQNKIEVKEDEVNASLRQMLQNFPGQEQAVLDYYKNTPGAVAELRAPIFEDKVVDFLIELVKTNDKVYEKEDFEKMIEKQMKEDGDV